MVLGYAVGAVRGENISSGAASALLFGIATGYGLRSVNSMFCVLDC